MEPNLFHYASSELSQDAFLLWLLEWANPANAEYDFELHKTASDFLWQILDADEDFAIHSVTCEKQKYHIDVLAFLNDKIAVIIEDKVNSLEHGDQIARYRKNLAEALGSLYDIRCVYLKTGNECLTKLRCQSEKGNFKICTRKNILDILEKSKSSNPILRDFVLNLKQLDEWTESFRTKLYSEWKRDVAPWQGYYSWLEENAEEWLEWRYVSNPKGGFWACFGHWKWSEEYNSTLYLQFEQERICIKADSRPQKETVKSCYEKLASSAARVGIHLEKPRFHRGQYVTVGFADTRVFFPSDVFDEKEVLEKWNLLKGILDEVAK